LRGIRDGVFGGLEADWLQQVVPQGLCEDGVAVLAEVEAVRREELEIHRSIRLLGRLINITHEGLKNEGEVGSSVEGAVGLELLLSGVVEHGLLLYHIVRPNRVPLAPTLYYVKSQTSELTDVNLHQHLHLEHAGETDNHPRNIVVQNLDRPGDVIDEVES